LRLFYVEELSCEAIGKIYAVNKATVSRWLSSARADVLDAARGHVRAELQAPAHEVESLLGLVKSGLDISLHALLA
jgi:RNA polymerase sigma-70 factor (ECF subfamily)